MDVVEAFKVVQDVVTSIRKTRSDHKVESGKIIEGITITSASLEHLVILVENEGVIKALAKTGPIRFVYSGDDPAIQDLITIAKS